MAQDYSSKWVRGASTFSFVAPYELEVWEEEEIHYDIPSAKAKGGDGEYQEDATADPRIVTVTGILQGSDATTLRGYWDTLTGALLGKTEGQLYKSSDRYINGRVIFVKRDPDDGLNNLRWTMGLRCADPYYYETTTQSVSLAVGTTAITGGGTVPALPFFSLVVSSIGTAGTFTVTHPGTGQSFVLTPSATGTYLIDCALGTITVGGVDASAQFSGSLMDLGLIVATSSITIAATGSATLTGASTISWRRRYASS